MIVISILFAALLIGLAADAFDDDDGGAEFIEGGDGDDTLLGTDDDDIMIGNSGDDDLTGRGGDDVLLGGADDDLLKGRSGDDWINGGDGDDNIRGGMGNDLLEGSSGNDTLMGAEGNDTIVGTDIFNRDLTSDDLRALLNGASFDEIGVFYEPQDAPEQNELYGGEGDDHLLLGEGDTGTGGDGNDVFYIGEWVDDPDNVPVITDLNTDEDALVVRYAAGSPTPSITVETQGSERVVLADGQIIARTQSSGGAELTSDMVYLVEVA